MAKWNGFDIRPSSVIEFFMEELGGKIAFMYKGNFYLLVASVGDVDLFKVSSSSLSECFDYLEETLVTNSLAQLVKTYAPSSSE